MRKQIFTGASFAVALAVFLGGFPSAIPQGARPVLPIFEVDPKFPTMPDHLLLGGVGGATADSHGNVWVFHRPHTLEEGMPRRMDTSPLRLSSNSARTANTSRDGAAR